VKNTARINSLFRSEISNERLFLGLSMDRKDRVKEADAGTSWTDLPSCLQLRLAVNVAVDFELNGI